jgi:hypothetical protein
MDAVQDSGVKAAGPALAAPAMPRAMPATAGTAAATMITRFRFRFMPGG